VFTYLRVGIENLKS